MSEYQSNAIFWVETMKIKPNPFQPRREFEPGSLEDLADSIRQYGVLQPLVVTRKETLRPESDGMDVHYELIAGERRLRASKIAGLAQVPVIIRKETDDKVKLELAIIENLQREDLNPIDRALAFEQLYKQFKLTHVEIGKRMGKSRVYVSNSLRLLSLPEEIKKGLMEGRITEGHTRPLLMLTDRPEEQSTLYKEIMVKKMSVRDAEKVARKIAQDKVRKKEFIVDPKIRKYEKQLSENLGTRVQIEPKEQGGQITIDYFTINDLEQILTSMKSVEQEETMMASFLNSKSKEKDTSEFSYLTGNNLKSENTGDEPDNTENEIKVENHEIQSVSINSENTDENLIKTQQDLAEMPETKNIVDEDYERQTLPDTEDQQANYQEEDKNQDRDEKNNGFTKDQKDKYTEPITQDDLTMPDTASNGRDPHILFNDPNSNTGAEYARKSFDETPAQKHEPSLSQHMDGDLEAENQNSNQINISALNSEGSTVIETDYNEQVYGGKIVPNAHEDVLPENDEFIQNIQQQTSNTIEPQPEDREPQTQAPEPVQPQDAVQNKSGYFQDGAYYQGPPPKKKGFFGKLFG
ncbi:hypothetical protein CL684_00050 [Candidatus Campbellbacteria bacterium]|nr:hypothetical protein [Candidatus Campbellbacteria bacterium]|tara:strand:- start:2999 stop:4738 length:1740 start_codon:yes stop_codon:yes gene_type:complete